MCSEYLARKARAGSLALVAGLSLAAAVLGGDTATAAKRDWPARISAQYKITFNGFDIGNFRFAANVTANKYVLSGDAEISALLGVVRWHGLTQVQGRLDADGVEPASYTFDFRSNSKSGTVRMGFRKGDVAVIAADPPLPSVPGEIPLERRHLSGVLDPLSTVMMLTNAGSGSPCGRKLPVFDGKQRFDLSLLDRGERPLPSRNRIANDGLGGVLHVCGVRYSPIAGYRPGGETDALARSQDIEITFRSVVGTGLFVPQQISIPTGVGTAVLALERMDVRAANAGQIAFVD